MKYSVIALACYAMLSQATFAAELKEAESGFRSPVDFTPSASGFHFSDDTVKMNIPSGVNPYPYCGDVTIYHPGEDINAANNLDKEKPIHAVADGIVVDVSSGDWKAILIKHLYKGKIYYSLYGHGKDIAVGKGDTVTKGQAIGKIWDNGADGQYHLHFEIRNEDHDEPENVDYFCENTSPEKVRRMYEDPLKFVQSHGPQPLTLTRIGDIAWYPAGATCVNAQRHFRVTKLPGFATLKPEYQWQYTKETVALCDEFDRLLSDAQLAKFRADIENAFFGTGLPQCRVIAP